VLSTVRSVAAALALVGSSYPAGRIYELKGHLEPESPAGVSLFGATAPFQSFTSADSKGRFRFRRLAPGQYTLAVFVPGNGEFRQTLDIGPGTADAKRRVILTIHIENTLPGSGEVFAERAKVSARQLSIPAAAQHEYGEAQKRLAEPDVPAAVAHLEKAVELAPQFSAAWNDLGTIAYHARQYERAESCFRKALAADPDSFAALVNLGGVLLNLSKRDEALRYNSMAVRRRPEDALANSQLGLAYSVAGDLDLAVKYLQNAKRIDPGHFSNPQLALAEIYLRRNERGAAAQEYRDFLRRHPDAPQAAGVRESLAKLEN
jgi:tetratricopeptide (TPR) repeat protein